MIWWHFVLSISISPTQFSLILNKGLFTARTCLISNSNNELVSWLRNKCRSTLPQSFSYYKNLLSIGFIVSRRPKCHLSFEVSVLFLLKLPLRKSVYPPSCIPSLFYYQWSGLSSLLRSKYIQHPITRGSLAQKTTQV